MKLIIIGNGFDLAHGLPTSFNDFRDYLAKDQKNYEFIDKINKILSNHSKKVNDKYEWNEIEKIFYLEENRIIDNKITGQLEIFELTLQEFEEKIDEYLTEVVKPKIEQIALIDNIKKEITPDSIVYNFNYTNLYKKYLNISSVINIHGNIDDENSNLIVGYYKDDPLTRHLNDTTNYKLLFKPGVVSKTKQSFKYNNIDLTNRINQIDHSSTIGEIVIIGFSFGESDDHIYKIIYNHISKKYSSNIVQSDEYKNKGDIKIKIFDHENDSEEKYNKIIGKLKSEKIITQIAVTGLTENGKKLYNSTNKNVFPFVRCEYMDKKELSENEGK